MALRQLDTENEFVDVLYMLHVRETDTVPMRSPMPRAECEHDGVMPRPSKDLLVPERRRHLVAGHWSRQRAIHSNEARASLAQLARAARRRECHGTGVPSLCYQMADVLATVRGCARGLVLLGDVW